ncbi:MAG: 30S ribosomal protein S20 [Candidatus Levyibacteriota bacterium]
MPVTKSAKKKLRQDKERTKRNKKLLGTLKDLIHKAKKERTQNSVEDAVKMADKARKKHLIHKNKVARIKSSLAKVTGKKTPVKK